MNQVTIQPVMSSVTHNDIYDAVLYDYHSAQQSERRFIAEFKANPESLKNALMYRYNFIRKTFYQTIMQGMDSLTYVDLIDWLNGQLQAIHSFMKTDTALNDRCSAMEYQQRNQLNFHKITYMIELLYALR